MHVFQFTTIKKFKLQSMISARVKIWRGETFANVIQLGKIYGLCTKRAIIAYLKGGSD